MANRSRIDDKATVAPPEFVKSAGRVLFILEYFDCIQRPANLNEVCRSLGFPLSSTSHLLWSMVKLGFLRFNQDGRTFIPTSRVSLLGTWTESRLFRGGKIYEFVEDLADETDCIIILSARDSVTSKCIFSADRHGLNASRAIVGDVRKLHETAAGIALLSALPQLEAGKILRRIISDTIGGAESLNVNKVTAKISDASRCGFALDEAGYGEIAMTVDLGEGLSHAISCYGQRDHVVADADFIVDRMRCLIALHLVRPKREERPGVVNQGLMVKFPQRRAVAADAAIEN